MMIASMKEDWLERDMRELSRETEIFSIIVRVWVAWVYLFVKIVLLRFMHFPELNLSEHLKMPITTVA